MAYNCRQFVKGILKNEYARFSHFFSLKQQNILHQIFIKLHFTYYSILIFNLRMWLFKNYLYAKNYDTHFLEFLNVMLSLILCHQAISVIHHFVQEMGV